MYSNELVCNIIEYLNKNINKEITIDELSRQFHFDKTYIMKRFKKELNVSIHEYINTIRILNSLKYFRDDTYFLSIAFKNGFNSLEYFSETFKKIVGVNPTTYKKFISYKNDVSEEEEISILTNLSNIYNIKKSANEYLNHRKPTENYYKAIKLRY